MGGKNLLTEALPALEKFNQWALEIIFNEAIKGS
jgi:hypothetical protein